MARYRDAIAWLATEDDTTWLDQELTDGADEVSPSVAACLVADVFRRPVEVVIADLRSLLGRQIG